MLQTQEKKKNVYRYPQKYMAYLALCLQSHTCSNSCFLGPPWSEIWWVQHLAGGVVTDLREVYLEHLEQNPKCFFFKGCDWRCDSPPWLARLRNTVFFFVFVFVCAFAPTSQRKLGGISVPLITSPSLSWKRHGAAARSDGVSPWWLLLIFLQVVLLF